jgi:cobyrinic acid a,c-diamide synthase
VIAGALIIGAPAVFFTVAFMPALMNTKGAVVGYKIHRDYGDTSIFTNITGTEQ